jgi:hypothetical protein
MSASDEHEKRHQQLLEEYGVDKFRCQSIGHRDQQALKFDAHLRVGQSKWRPGWKSSHHPSGNVSNQTWWSLHPEHAEQDAELASLLKTHFLNDPTKIYWQKVQDEICKVAAVAASNYWGQEVSPASISRQFEGARFLHILYTTNAVILAIPSPVYETIDAQRINRAYQIDPQAFHSPPDLPPDRLAIFLEGARALTYAEAGKLLEDSDMLPSTTAMRGATSAVIIDRRHLWPTLANS